MKKVLFLAFMFCASFILNAQLAYFPSEGTVLTYHNLDKKGKIESKIVYKVESVKQSGENAEVTYFVESYGKKDELVFKDRITFKKEGDKLFFDMSNFVNKGAFQQNGEIPATVEIEGNSLEVPINGTAGQSLPDANMTIASDMGFVKLKMTTNIVNRKVDDIEDLTVPAGTFNCMKISGDVSGKILGMNMSGKSVQWYSSGIGMVKSETYDKKGELSGSMVLVAVSK
ncbi:MAG: hypothetical protein PHR13_09850 [Dysgonamonadaceae bacterium]|jgi:hypothetical protein|nr:hypothetical protein [Dysgonamonadaceae bacterium]MDD4399802.1 hypothetical protein [Dysgonamonadaceae bacterium]